MASNTNNNIGLTLTGREAARLNAAIGTFLREVRALKKDSPRHRAEMDRLKAATRRNLDHIDAILGRVKSTH